ncbi:hypothetical protein V6N13_018435 [Hibiscus sabdariffa]
MLQELKKNCHLTYWLQRKTSRQANGIARNNPPFALADSNGKLAADEIDESFFGARDRQSAHRMIKSVLFFSQTQQNLEGTMAEE